MTLYPSDLAFITPDADGILRMNRGTVPQTPPPFPFPSFIGDTRMYSGLAADVGVGDLLGWELVAGITAGTLVRLATTDAEVGVISGTNLLQPTAQLPTGQTPTGTYDANHDHGGAATATGASPQNLGGTGTNVTGMSHTHPIAAGLVSLRPVTMDPLVLDPLVLDPITISPQAYCVYLIRFTGVAAAAP